MMLLYLTTGTDGIADDALEVQMEEVDAMKNVANTELDFRLCLHLVHKRAEYHHHKILFGFGNGDRL